MGVDFGDISAFLAVAKAGGFRDAARSSGDSASRLSEAVRRLEARLGVRLFHRTTRSVELTAVGRELTDRLAPAIAEVDLALDIVNGYRERIGGLLKLNVPVSAARLVLPDIVPPFLAAYPDIQLEIVAEDTFVDLVASGCDAGIRYDERLEQDMIAVPIGPEMRMAVVGSPAYFERYPIPVTPQDLVQHNCINFRLPTYGGLFPWEFEKDGRELKVRVEGQLIFNTLALRLNSALAGLGLVYMPEDEATGSIAEGRLIRVLEDWCEPFPGYHLYYPSRRHSSPALAVLLEALRYRRR